MSGREGKSSKLDQARTRERGGWLAQEIQGKKDRWSRRTWEKERCSPRKKKEVRRGNKESNMGKRRGRTEKEKETESETDRWSRRT